MRPNEVISELEKLSYPIVVNLMGNHEKALLDGDLSHFSTERGKQMLQYTSSILSESSLLYIKENMISTGLHAIECQGKHLLFLHGSINDVFWGKLDLTPFPIFIIVIMTMFFRGILIFLIICHVFIRMNVLACVIRKNSFHKSRFCRTTTQSKSLCPICLF